MGRRGEGEGGSSRPSQKLRRAIAIRESVHSVSLSIPVVGGRPALGTWQGLYLFEHRSHPETRSVILHLVGA